MMDRLLPDDIPEMLTVDELCNILRIGRRQGYELVHRHGFPSCRVGGRSIRIPKAALERWLQENAGRLNEDQWGQRDTAPGGEG